MRRSFATTTGEPAWSPSDSPEPPGGTALEVPPSAPACPAPPLPEASAAPVTPVVIRLPDPASVGAWVAERLLRERLEAPDQPIGLATGRTMEPVYGALAAGVAALRGPERQALREGWLSFNLDEYVGLGADDPRSFAAEMTRRLVAPLGLEPSRVCLPDGGAADPAAEARRYAGAVAAAGGIGLQLLGLGGNGHLGFNEPPSAPGLGCRVVELSDATRRQNAAAFGGDPGCVPERAITLGLAEILAARRLLLVVTGSAKASILRRVLDAPPTDAVPASWIQRHPAVVVVADAAALDGPALPAASEHGGLA